MNSAPILVLQMQRMGDLVLTFPLLGQLAVCYPGHPLWVVSEPRFFKPLVPLSPPATYFGYHSAAKLAQQRYHMVLNLSHRPKAAALAGRVQAEIVIGPWLDSNQQLFIQGDWQLYRSSLTNNNHFNRYHWSDLNALDVISDQAMIHTQWPRPRKLFRGRQRSASSAAGLADAMPPPRDSKQKNTLTTRRVGLFLGASDAQKHPDAKFWIRLSTALMRAGIRLVFLGGEAEVPLGREVSRKLASPQLNLCGRFAVRELAGFIGGLDLLITPDTGPMHVATWSGTPTLNLSLGPVNPWETGPFAPGHHVMRAPLPCSGCWGCGEQSQICRELLQPGKVAALVQDLLAGTIADIDTRKARGLEVLRTGRGVHGLFRLRPRFQPLPMAENATPRLTAEHAFPEARDALSDFWQVWFGVIFGRFADEELFEARTALKEAAPQAAAALRLAAVEFSLLFSKSFSVDPYMLLREVDFWQGASFLLRPLSGYIQMYVQNAMGSRAAFVHCLRLLERLIEEQ